jgi:hypothetical protein
MVENVFVVERDRRQRHHDLPTRHRYLRKVVFG